MTTRLQKRPTIIQNPVVQRKRQGNEYAPPRRVVQSGDGVVSVYAHDASLPELERGAEDWVTLVSKSNYYTVLDKERLVAETVAYKIATERVNEKRMIARDVLVLIAIIGISIGVTTVAYALLAIGWNLHQQDIIGVFWWCVVAMGGVLVGASAGVNLRQVRRRARKEKRDTTLASRSVRGIMRHEFAGR